MTVRFVADFQTFEKAMDDALRKLRLLDELHAHKTSGVWNAMTARPQPVALAIPLALTAAALVASPKRFSRRSLLGLNWGSR